MRKFATDENSTGALALSVVNCQVMRRGFMALLGLTAVAAALATEPPTDVSFDQLSRYRPDLVRAGDSLSLLQSLPMLVYLDAQFFPASPELGPGPAGVDQVFPRVVVHGSQKGKLSTGLVDAKDTTKTVQAIPQHPLYYSGEVGTYVGHASGKVHGDAFGSYLESTVGDDHFQISVGGSYDQFNGRGPRRGW